MSRWEKAGYDGAAAVVRSGRDVCMATVYRMPGKFDGYGATAHVNWNDPSSGRQRGWSASVNYYDKAKAKRDAIRACGMMLRGLNK